MSRIAKSREELIEVYNSVSENEWEEMLKNLAVKGELISKPLYHLSSKDFKNDVYITVKPVEGINGQYNPEKQDNLTIYTELLPPRFCMSDNLLGCWKGICAELELKLIKDNAGKSFQMFLYRIESFKNTKILTPDVLGNNYILHDAHITNEHCLIEGKVKIIKERVITFENTTYVKDHECYFYYPFNEKKYGKQMVGIPMRILKEEYP